ncbi:MAG: hypothetical protein BZY81_00480 [SAR202 cluster bacterium Io17-Chloro-G4]|nr:MAG: hypothetical protein BZY81_00480 [SAR202 cluster bacterium Io17-Chloro-G4]
MPTNVTPQYRSAEERFRQAKTSQEKIIALQEMLSVMPKHKGTDHLKAQLRARMSKLMADLEGPSRGSRSGNVEPFSLPKQGAGRATLVGPTNVGKSLLLTKATGAHSKVGSYALSTMEPVPGMLSYEDIYIQLVDTPPIANLSTQGRLYGLLRMSDVLLVVVDLSGDPVSQAQECIQALEEWGFVISGIGVGEQGDNSELEKPVIIVGNKADVPGSLDSFQLLESRLGENYPVLLVSAEEEVGLDELGETLFRELGIIRVYTRAPQQKQEETKRGAPFVLPEGSTVADASAYVHKDLVRNLKYAVLWGRSSKFEGQHVGRDHRLHDGDLIELHS